MFPELSNVRKFLGLVCIFLVCFLVTSNSYGFGNPTSTSFGFRAFRHTLMINHFSQYRHLTIMEKENLFQEFITKYHRSYHLKNQQEYNERFTNFVEFLQQIDLRNAAELAHGGQAIHGITKFADYSKDEIMTLFGYSSTIAETRPVYVEPTIEDVTMTNRDWTGIYTSAVKDQGHCASSWAFAVSQQIESDIMRIYNEPVTLSTQQMISCDAIDNGCKGGHPDLAYLYVKESGISVDTSYAYVSYDGTSASCQSHVTPNYKLDNFATLIDELNPSKDVENQMKSHVLTTGPLSVCLDASTWTSYRGGVMTVCPKETNHCAQIVGIDLINGTWKVRNSWSNEWGEDGFIHLKFGSNTCGITSNPSFSYPTKLH